MPSIAFLWLAHAGEDAGWIQRRVVALTWLWGLFAYMLGFHGPNASTEHDGLDPLTSLTTWKLETQRAGKS